MEGARQERGMEGGAKERSTYEDSNDRVVVWVVGVVGEAFDNLEHVENELVVN